MQNQFTNQENDKRDQEHQELYWFTLPQELHPIYLPTSKEIQLKNQLVQSTQSIHSCTLQEHTLTPYKNTHKLCRTLLHFYKHKPYTLTEKQHSNIMFNKKRNQYCNYKSKPVKEINYENFCVMQNQSTLSFTKDELKESQSLFFLN